MAKAGSVVPVLTAQTTAEPKLEHDLLVARVSWQSRALKERERKLLINLLLIYFILQLFIAFV